ncbi:MAG: ankyrin repeat domain-containing protein [Clostridia bacterium]
MTYRIRVIGLAVLVGFFSASPAAAQFIDPVVSGEMSANVFEVVVRKPTVDTVRYAERLPIELLPYAERNDAYVSVGTAFALRDGRFISAAHVFGLERPTLRAEYALRDTQGKVFPIGRVSAYSYWKDYIAFEVPGLNVQGLEVRTDPPMNIRVFSIGNALGEGVVIRDGILTSRTQEAWKGSWRWLRFSAPASPGNSGGPLIDEQGRVLGIVLRKSENENLNYALPVSEIARDSTAWLDDRTNYGLPNIVNSVYIELHDAIPLPLELNGLREELSQRVSKAYIEAARRVVSENQDTVFPEAPGSEAYFGNMKWNAMPAVMVQQSNGTWVLTEPEKPTTFQIAKDEQLSWSELLDHVFLRYDVPSTERLTTLITNPREFMDSFLAGFSLSRNVAGKDIRILSFGDPSETRFWADRWGRKWQTAVWTMPLFDLTFNLTWTVTPDGIAAIYRQNSFGSQVEYEADLKMMCDFISVSYRGSLNEWQNFLGLRTQLPENFAHWKLDYQPGNYLKLTTPRFNLVPDSAAVDISKTGILSVQPAWYREPGGVVWDVGLVMYADQENADQINFWYKLVKPTDSAKNSDQSFWTSVVSREYPYNGESIVSNGNTNGFYSISPAQQTPEPLFLYLAHTYFKGSMDKLKAEGRIKSAAEALLPSRRENLLARGDDPMSAFSDYKLIEGRDIFDAVNQEDLELLEQYIQSSWDLEIPDENGDTALLAAIRNKKLEIAEKLAFTGWAINQTDSEGNTPLMIATMQGFDHLCDSLLAKGADPNHFNNQGESALTLTLRSGRNAITARLLAFPDIDISAGNGAWHPLMAALRYSDAQTSHQLLQRLPATAIQSITSKDGWTPLHVAARYRSDFVPTLLALDQTALFKTTDSGASPLHFAASNGGTDALESLLAAGADPCLADKAGWTALMAALRAGATDNVRLLLQQNGGWDGRTTEGWTVFHIAARYAPELYREVAKVTGAEAETRALGLATSTGYHPLHLAVVSHNRSLVRYLLGRGADRNSRTASGQTALDLARESAEPGIIQLLSTAQEEARRR